MQKGSSKKIDQVLFIVDYDVPREPSSKRRTFYREMTKMKKKMGLFAKMSTMSVIVTTNRALATQIYHLVKTYGGKANFYSGFHRCGDE